MSLAVPAETRAEQQWWLSECGTPNGPHSESYILVGLKTGAISAQTYACPVGGQQWKRLDEWPLFAEVRPVAPPPPPPRPHARAVPATDGRPMEAPFTNAALPSMANWICIYTVLVSPVYWFISNLSCQFTGMNFRDDAQAISTEVRLRLLFSLVSFAIATTLLLGGLRLRSLRRTGITLLKAGLWADLVCPIAAIILLAVLLISAGPDELAESTPAGAVIAFLELAVGVLLYAFEVYALVWLHRNGSLLELAQAPPAAPWNPRVLAWLGLVFSPAWSGVTAAINGQRLGIDSPPWRPIAVGFGLLFAGLLLWVLGVSSWFPHTAIYLGAAWLIWLCDLQAQSTVYEKTKTAVPSPTARWMVPLLCGAPLAVLLGLLFIVGPVSDWVSSSGNAANVMISSPRPANNNSGGVWEGIVKNPRKIIAFCVVIGWLCKALAKRLGDGSQTKSE